MNYIWGLGRRRPPVVATRPPVRMHLVRTERSQPMRNRFASTQNVNERFEVILQIEHYVLHLSQRPHGHQNDAVQWTARSEAIRSEPQEVIFPQCVGELKHSLCDLSLQI